MDQTRDRGFTLVEMMMGTVVFVIAAVVMGNHLTSSYRETNEQRDRVFAYTKAQAILSEIHSLVDRGDVEAAVDLDQYDDGVLRRPSLTINEDDGTLLPADHPVSGNTMRDGQWVWARSISVRPFSGLNNRNMRYVTIRIFKRSQNGSEREFASLSSVVNSVASSFPATQVFDVYLLAIDTIPGWWVYMEAIVPFVESAITDLEARNPGLSVRTHWINKAGFGRNQMYRPYINDEFDSHETVDDVYFYPGRMPDGSSSTYYYVPDIIKGRVNLDGTPINEWDSQTNPYPYALADYYNHCMRAPRARALHDLRVAEVEARREAIRTAELSGLVPPDDLVDMSAEPPLQLLLDDMAQSPEEYRNALLINLHGELLPTAPTRNYSDAARLPERLPGARVVTHPEELRTQSPQGVPGEEQDVRLRVYGWTDDFDNMPVGLNNGRMPLDVPIVMEVMDVDLCGLEPVGYLRPEVQLERIAGGVFVGGDNTYRPPEPAPCLHDITGSFDEEMFYYAFFQPGFSGERARTFIYMWNTPMTAPTDVDGRGLWRNQRSLLYGREYIPSPTGSTIDFSRNLSSLGDGPKNTARWVLNIPVEAWDQEWFAEPGFPTTYYDPADVGDGDQLVTVRTRMLDQSQPDPFLSGTVPGGSVGFYFQPDNLSETYTWWAENADAVPPSERYQMHGDPRHVPYLDTCMDAGQKPDFPDAYNWFYDTLQNHSQNSRADYPGIQRGWNKFNGGPHFDIPRAMQLFREALIGANAIYTTLSGYSYYYVGCGNEIGYDSANGYPNSIPVNQHPWGGSEGATGFQNNITGVRKWVRSGAGSGDHWYGRPWLGELYPDWAYLTDWSADDGSGGVRGNLTAGSQVSEFRRQNHESVHDTSTVLRRGWGTDCDSSHHRTNSRGCVTFFNNGTSSSHFNHHFSGGQGSIVGAGQDLVDNYGFPIPNRAEASRPFSLNTGGNVPQHYNFAPYSNNRATATLVDRFYSHPSGYQSSGLVELEGPDRTDAAWIVVNGLSQTTELGSAFLAKYCLLSMYQSFFELGDQSATHRIQQPPRLEIISPTEISELENPSVIEIQIETQWRRWDRLPYTSGTPSDFAEDETNLRYLVMYSPDNGSTWHYIQDQSVATPGETPPNDLYYLDDASVGDEFIDWDVSASDFPEGSYVLRVEAHRFDVRLHYSVHQVKVYVQR
ncbi:MAG: prepilin-type N-terminal cleavage/methylation domain-containing protein [Planctomycetota bacterium]